MPSEKAVALLEYAGLNGRFCPQPQAWDRLWKLLPERRQKPSGGWSPPLPLILAAWWDATGLDKMLRLQEHIEWADAHGAIDAVDSYLRGLSEEEWFHGTD